MPLLLNFSGKTIAATGKSQHATLTTVREQCDVSVGVKRSIACIEHLAPVIQPLRQSSYVDTLLEFLAQSQCISSNRKPVLSVGRDEITLRSHKHSFFEVDTDTTNSVYVGAGKRMRTIY